MQHAQQGDQYEQNNPQTCDLVTLRIIFRPLKAAWCSALVWPHVAPLALAVLVATVRLCVAGPIPVLFGVFWPTVEGSQRAARRSLTVFR